MRRRRKRQTRMNDNTFACWSRRRRWFEAPVWRLRPRRRLLHLFLLSCLRLRQREFPSIAFALSAAAS